MNNTIKERLSLLRDRMKRIGGDICLITDNDPHISEYTGNYYKVREFFSGFTGSAGTLVVGLEKSWLFTDGRYFVQAEAQLSGTGITLMKSGTKGVPNPIEFIKQQVGEKKTTLLTDGTLLKVSDGISLRESPYIELRDDFDPAEGIWTDRPERSNQEIFPLEVKFAGETAESKLSRIKEKIQAEGCDCHIIGSLEDIAWILNLRGSDIACTPVFEAFLVIGEETVLFVNEAVLSEKALNVLNAAKVSTQNYDRIYDYVEGIGKAGHKNESSVEVGGRLLVLADKQRLNYKIISSMLRNSHKSSRADREDFCAEIKYAENPSVLMRAVKNDTQIRHLKAVHEDDGMCVTRLMYMVKNGKLRTEAEAADYIDGLRREISDCVDLSFPTISAFGAHAAMMHYTFDREDITDITPGGMLLVDSGGQYLRGTTDVTRTFVAGSAAFTDIDVLPEHKKAYTLALKGLLALSDAVFLKGTSGYGLDILARQFLWREGTDYRCGTGHGVGYMLNVHEGPNAFRYKYIPGVSDYCELEPGMVTTNEPGVYEEGRFGLRIENELLCVKAFENEYGEFLKFETLTLAPYDRDLILAEMLTEHESKLIDDYHKRVYEVLAPRLSGEEIEFLREYTKPL